MRKLCLAIVFFSAVFTHAQTPETTEAGGGPGFFIAPLTELIGYSRKGPALGGGLALGMGDGFAAGFRLLYAIDTEKLYTLEFLLFIRFFPFDIRGQSGLFFQINGGASLNGIRGAGSATGNNEGGLTADIAAGWRFPLGKPSAGQRQRWYIDPLIRTGYPFIFGLGAAFAYKF